MPRRPAIRIQPLRIVLGTLAIALCLVTAVAFLRQEQCVDAARVLIERAKLFAWAFLILLTALSFGSVLLRRLGLRPAGDGAAALFGLGTGLAVISALTLALGSLGLLGNVRAVCVLMALLFLGLRDLGTLLRGAITALKRARAASWFRMALWTVLGFFLLLNLTRAFEPPWQYDALEYHLAAPAAYHQAGRVFFMRDNVYANFPQNSEMLDLLAMDLADSPDRGTVVGQILGAALGFLAALALGGMIAGVAGKEAGAAAAALFYVWPGVTVYSGTAYVELPLIFYAMLALWGLLWSWRRKLTRPGPRGWVALAAISTGAALGVKYTAALLVFVPAVIWLVAFGCAARVKLKEIARRIALFAGIALLCFSPWLIRNIADTGNPVYPLLYRVFGSSNWDAQKDARWTQAHSPKDLFTEDANAPVRKGQPTWLEAAWLAVPYPIRNFLDHAYEALFVDSDEGTPKASLAVFLFAPLALLTGRRRRWIAVFLAADAALLLVLWFLFTQQNVRFAELVLPVLAGLSAVGLGAVLPSRHAMGLRGVVILLLLIEPARMVNYVLAERSLGCALGAASPDDFFKANSPGFRDGHYAAMQFLNDSEKLRSGSKILFLGEAQMFYCRRPYVASTVFDTNLLERTFVKISAFSNANQTPAEFEEVRETALFTSLRDAGITHLYVDTGELTRLQMTYRHTVRKGWEHLGNQDGTEWDVYSYKDHERLGMLNGFDWALFGQFATKHLRPVWTYPPSAEVASFPWERWPEFLKQADSGGRMPHFIAIYELR